MVRFFQLIPSSVWRVWTTFALCFTVVFEHSSKITLVFIAKVCRADRGLNFQLYIITFPDRGSKKTLCFMCFLNRRPRSNVHSEELDLCLGAGLGRAW